MFRSKSDLRKRTTENATLIQELHELRSSKKANESLIKNLEYRIKSLTQAILANKRAQGKTGSNKASNSNLPANTPLPLPLPRPVSAKPVKMPRGKVYKGSPFESKLVNVQEKQRIGELNKDLDDKKEENFYLKLEINQLREVLGKSELI